MFDPAINRDMRDSAITTIYSLDALAGTCKDIRCIVAFDGATAANITPILWMSDPDDTATLNQVYPDLDAGHTHAGARTEVFSLGDVTPYAESRDIAAALAEGALSADGSALQTPLDRIAA